MAAHRREPGMQYASISSSCSPGLTCTCTCPAGSMHRRRVLGRTGAARTPAVPPPSSLPTGPARNASVSPLHGKATSPAVAIGVLALPTTEPWCTLLTALPPFPLVLCHAYSCMLSVSRTAFFSSHRCAPTHTHAIVCWARGGVRR